MSSVDERVVKMKFENDAFKKKAAETQKSLADVNKSVDAAGKGKGLLDLSSNMQKVQVTASKMAVVTTTALATIANKVTNTALSMANSLTFDPIKQGFSEYESLLTKQNVIMNATGKSGKFVKSILNDLNAYSDQTIYSFGNMTDAITKFVNAGVPLKQSVQTIKGIANAAAFAGASSEEANRAMYAFSQSMSLGFVGLQDWMQIENANMGTIRFKNELLKAGVAAGTLTKQGKGFVTESGVFVSATKGWRDGLKEQWATTEVLNKALGKYADTNTKLGKQAFKAAQDVRTFSAFMDTLKESLGSGWSQIFTALIGDLGQSTKMWTGLSNSIGKVVHDFFQFGATALTTWRDLGGFEKTMEGFKNLLSPIGALLGTVGKAWREAFPNSSKGAGKTLYGISVGFEAITSPLRILANIIEGTTPILKTFFQILRIGGTAVGEAVGYVSRLVTGLLGMADLKAPSAGGLIDFVKDLAKAISNAVDEISTLLSKGQSLTQAFGSVSIDLPSLPSLPSLPKLGNLFGGGDESKQVAQVGELTASTKTLTTNVAKLKTTAMAVEKTALFSSTGTKAQQGLEMAGSAARVFGEDMVSAAENSETVGDKMGGLFDTLKERFANFAENFNFTTLVRAFNLAVLATFTISIARLFNTFSKGFTGFAQLGDTFNGVLENAGGALKSFQTAARAKLIIAVAVAIGVLAVSLWILSKIPADKLAIALGALGATFFMLNRSVKAITNLFNAMSGNGLSAAANMIVISIAIVSLAVAMLLLAGAMLIMNKVEWQSIVKGLVVMGAMMVVLQKLSSTVTGIKWAALLAAGAAMVAMAFAMTILAGALMLFSLVKWESMKKAGAALAGITVALGGLVALTKGPWGAAAMAAAGAGFAAAAVGMIALANALILFGLVKWESIKKAGVALAGLAIGMTLMVVGAAGGPGMLLASIGMNALATALMLFALVDYSSIGKMVLAMGGLALGLTILTPILYLAAPALILFGIAVASIGFGILAFATAMAIAVALSGAAAVALGALAIAAVAAIVLFLQALAAQAPIMKESFLAIIQTLVDTVVESVPIIIGGFKRLWEAIKKEIQGPEKKGESKKASKGWVSSIADGIEEKMPEIVRRATGIIIAFLKGLGSKARELGSAGANVIAKFLQGIADRMEGIVTAGTNLVIKFLEGIGANSLRLSLAAADLIISFVQSLAQTIRLKMPELQRAMLDVGVAMIDGLTGGLASKAGAAIAKIGEITSGMVNFARDKLKIFSPSKVFYSIGQFLVQGLTNGIQNNAAAAIVSVASMVSGQIATASEYISSFIQKLDQQSIAAMAKANGLAIAAAKAEKAANKTKTKADDKRADRLDDAAEKADKEARKAEAKAERAKEKAERLELYNESSTIDKAKMRSEDAQTALDKAKALEAKAAAARIAAEQLDKQSKVKGLTAKEREALRKQADDLRDQAKNYAQQANSQLNNARNAAADALALQQLAGEEAAAIFQEQFDLEARTAAEEEAFAKLTNAEKAAQRRAEAEELKLKSEADLARAKELAYTDLEAANALAQLALQEAEKAREYLKEAAGYENSTTGGGGALGSVVDLAPSEAAAIAFNQYSDLVDAANVAAAATRTVEFNQYNTSPESLSPSEIYRNTNNQLSFAIDKLDSDAA